MADAADAAATGQASNTSTGLAGTVGGSTGQTADPGLNPTSDKTEGNNTTLINEATGTKAAISGDPAVDTAKAALAVTGQLPVDKVEVEGDGDYDAATGIIRKGKVTLKDPNGVEVTKEAY